MVAAPVVIDNSSCQFKPHASFMYVKQTLNVSNNDKFGHNFKLDLLPKGFNSSIPPGVTMPFTLIDNNAAKKPKEFSCSIHTMNGWLQINENPFGAVSKADGTFEIKGLPLEELEFQIWHEQIGFVPKVKFKGGQADDTGRFKTTLKAGVLDLETISVPTSLISTKD